MSKTTLTPFQLHAKRWADGCGSAICWDARHVCLARGRVPCDVLFIGEAPGESEDVVGQPFVGPAGKLLDHIIARALPEGVSYAMTNVVGCIPRDAEGEKTTEPFPEEVKQCRPRLVEFVKLCKPRLIVLVGKVAARYVSGQAMFDPVDWLPEGEFVRFLEIVHPAAILRSNAVGQSLDIDRQVVRLRCAVEDM